MDSHGQAKTERGFIISSDLFVENMLDHYIAAQRRVYAHLFFSGSPPHDL